MVARCCGMILMCSLLRIPWMLEQPSSSLLEYHPLFKWIARVTDVFRAPCQEYTTQNWAKVKLFTVASCLAVVFMVGAAKVFVWVGAFGGESAWPATRRSQLCLQQKNGLRPQRGRGVPGPKPTYVYSNYRMISALYLPLPSNHKWAAEMSVKQLGMDASRAKGCLT